MPTFAQDFRFSAAQCRAGRAFLQWSIDRLSDKADIKAATISLFEREIRDPGLEKKAAIKKALEAGGVVFDCGRLECVCGPVAARP